jgi:hypothetical protein
MLPQTAIPAAKALLIKPLFTMDHSVAVQPEAHLEAMAARLLPALETAEAEAVQFSAQREAAAATGHFQEEVQEVELVLKMDTIPALAAAAALASSASGAGSNDLRNS